MGVEGRGVEIQPQYSLDPDSVDSFQENTEMQRFYSKLTKQEVTATVTTNNYLCINLITNCDLSIVEYLNIVQKQFVLWAEGDG